MLKKYFSGELMIAEIIHDPEYKNVLQKEKKQWNVR